MLKLLLIYVAFINLIGIAVMYIDKKRAKQGVYRIPEATLWKVAWLGGATGTWAGMKVFHHKTKHTQFVYGFPVLAIAEILFIAYLVIHFL